MLAMYKNNIGCSMLPGLELSLKLTFIIHLLFERLKLFFAHIMAFVLANPLIECLPSCTV